MPRLEVLLSIPFRNSFNISGLQVLGQHCVSCYITEDGSKTASMVLSIIIIIVLCIVLVYYYLGSTQARGTVVSRDIHTAQSELFGRCG